MQFAIPILLVLTFFTAPVAAQQPGTLVTVAGGGTQEGEGIPADSLALQTPVGIAVDAAGNLYVADTGNNRIRKIDAKTGDVTTVAGTGVAGFSGDGGPATAARINQAQDVTVDPAGDLYIADTGNRRIRKIDAKTGIITTIAGTGEKGSSASPQNGAPADSVTFDQIVAVLADGRGGLYVAEGYDIFQQGSTHRVRRIDLQADTIGAVAGTGGAGYSGDGGPATEAELAPQGLALDAAGNLYVADFNNHRIRKIDAKTGIITTVAGKGPSDIFGNGGFSGDGGPATDAYLNVPFGIAVDAAGNLYIADTGNNRVRVVEAGTGTIFTIAGTGVAGDGGDGGLALQAQLSLPTRLALDPSGNLLISDTDNGRIRRLTDPAFRTPLMGPVLSQIDFQQVSLGQDSTLFIPVQNRGNRALTVQSLASNNPVFTAPLLPYPVQIGPGQTGQLPVRFTPTAEGLETGTLILTTDDPLRPSLAISVQGTGAVPIIGVSPEALLFDRTAVGSQSTLNLQISNLGAGSLQISRVSLDDTTQFSVGFTAVLNIGAGQTASLPVTFRPARTDTQRANLTLYSNDPTTPALTVSLTGFAVPKPEGFTDVSDSLGLGDPGAAFGAAWGDFNGDGRPDLYVVRSLQPNLLYRNDGNRFTEVGAQMGVADAGDGSGATWADFDGDGDLDLYVTNFDGPNRLYRNDGDHFTEVGAQMGVADAGDSYGAAWADFNGDGRPDLYVADFGPNHLYRNDGGHFTDVAVQLGVADSSSSVQPAWADYDNDGDPDLFLANSGANRLFRNDGGHFTDVTAKSGLQGNLPSFGAAWGDFNNDGNLDLFVANFNAPNQLYLNNGNGTFQEVEQQYNVAYADSGRSRGAVWADIDNDGDLDLYVTNSGQPNLLYRNDGDHFTEVGDSLGVAVQADSRGVAVADYDRDGALDLYVAVQNGPDHLFRNRQANGNWLLVRPTGIESSTDAIGTRVEVAYEGGREIREVTGGSSYLSENALEVAFGLGGATQVDTLTLRWPSGIVQRLLNVPVNQILPVTEARPLPAVRVLLQTDNATLVANGQAETLLQARVVNEQNGQALVNGFPILFHLQGGGGTLVGGDSVQVHDGQASIRYRAGTTPGQALISAGAPGLLSSSLVLNLLTPIGPSQSTVRTVVGVAAGLRFPSGVAVDSSGNVYISDAQGQRIREIGPDSILTTLAGDGTAASTGDGGPASAAQVSNPQGLALLPGGGLVLADQGGQRVRRIDLRTDSIFAFAGTGIASFGGDGRAAVKANLSTPQGVAADGRGNVWIADRFNNRVRMVDAHGIITTVAGSNRTGFSGDGGPATQAGLSQPQGVAVDSLGRLYIADTGDNRIRMVDENGIITTIAGTGTPGFSGDGGPAAQAQLNAPQAVAVDGSGHLFIADTGNNRIRAMDLSTGIIQTVAGTGFQGSSLGSSALSTDLDTPWDLYAAPSGDVYVADAGNNRILALTVAFPGPPGSSIPPGDEAADFNGDGRIDFSDFILFAQAYGSTNPRYDLDGSGVVGFSDFLRFAAAYQRANSTSNSAARAGATSR